MSSRILVSLIFFLLSLLSFIVGSYLMGKAWKNRQRWQRIAEWPRTFARIKTFKILTEKNDDGDEVYVIKIIYQYMVSGESYENSRLALGTMLNELCEDSQFLREKLNELWEQGRPLPIYYFPRNPKESAICRGGTKVDLVCMTTLAIALLILSTGLAIGGSLYWHNAMDYSRWFKGIFAYVFLAFAVVSVIVIRESLDLMVETETDILNL